MFPNQFLCLNIYDIIVIIYNIIHCVLTVWLNGVARINVVVLRQAGLLLRWVIVYL